MKLSDLIGALSPAQRASLSRIQSDPRARAILGHEDAVKRAAAEPVKVEAFARVEADGTVRLHAKGLRLVNGANAREHPLVRAKRFAVEHRLIGDALASIDRPDCVRFVVTITREGKRLMDDDGLAISAKGIRDAVAGWLGVDDGPKGPVTWRYEQRTAKGYGVSVTIVCDESTRNP